MLFDARAAKLLKAGEHMVIEGCPGLRLVGAPKWKTWVYRYKAADGRMKQLRFGRWPDVSASEAVTAWQSLRSGKAYGKDPGQERKSEKLKAAASLRHAHTVADLLNLYLSEVAQKKRKPASYQAAKRMLARFATDHPSIASAPPETLTRTQAFEVIAFRADTPMSATKLRSLLGSAWDHALDSGRISDTTPNWWRQIMHGKLRSKGKIVGGQHQGQTHHVLSLKEAHDVLAYGRDHMHPHAFCLLVLYLWTAQRGGEILAMQPSQLRMDGDVLWWTLPKAKTKNAHISRAVDQRTPLFGPAREVVLARLAAAESGECFFPNLKGKPYTQRAFGNAVYDLMPNSPRGIKRGNGWPVSGWSAHRLRATSRTLLAALGCPDDVGEAILGHLPPETQGTYNRHTFDDEKMKWLSKLSDALTEYELKNKTNAN